MPDNAIPAPWIPTPGYLHDRARAIHGGLLALNELLDQASKGGRIARDTGKFRAWKALLDRWGKWYGDWDGASGLWSATDATLDLYDSELRSWRAWAARALPDEAATLPPVRPPIGAPWASRGSPQPLSPWAWALLLGAGGFVAWRILR